MTNRRLVPVWILAALLSAIPAGAQVGPQPRVGTFANPLDVRGADPYVILEQGVYYLYLATAPEPGVEVWSSRDLARWQYRGFAYRPRANDWARKLLWAPCVVRQGSRYLMYFNAVNNDSQGHRIVVAQSNSPTGPFTDVKAPMWDPGYAMIDSDVFIDNDGRGYLYYSRDISQAEVSTSWVVPLARDLLSVAGEPVKCVEPSNEWEGKWNEAPCVFRHGDTYFLLYSGPEYTSPRYSVGYAISQSPMGPWRKPQYAPVLTRTPWTAGPGHPCVVSSPDGREMYMVYHTHQQLEGGGARQIAADRMRVVTDPFAGVRLQVDGPTTLLQKTPSGVVGPLAAASDEFNSSSLDRERWTIVNEDPGAWRLQNGKLVITTQDGDVWGSRFDLRNVFLQSPLPGDFEIVARVELRVQRNFDQAFLIIWGDHNNYIRLSHAYVGGRRWQIVRELNGEVYREEVPNTIGDNVWMKITKRGRSYQCEVSLAGQKWWPVGPPLAADFPEIQVGLGAACPGAGRRIDAEFDFFRVDGGTPSGPRLGTPSTPGR